MTYRPGPYKLLGMHASLHDHAGLESVSEEEGWEAVQDISSPQYKHHRHQVARLAKSTLTHSNLGNQMNATDTTMRQSVDATG